MMRHFIIVRGNNYEARTIQFRLTIPQLHLTAVQQNVDGQQMVFIYSAHQKLIQLPTKHLNAYILINILTKDTSNYSNYRYA